MANRNLTSAKMADLLRQQRQYNNQIEDAKRIEEEQRIKTTKKDSSIWEKIGDTLLDFGANFVGGASKAIEGLVDAGSAVAGNVAGWFGADDFKQQMQENIAYDWTGNNITNPANEITDASLLNDSKVGQYIEGMAQGVGQLLPTVAVSFIPGVGAGLAKVMLFGSAMGNSTEEAVNEGTDLGTASVYGALSGGVELLSERISGKLFGATKIDKTYGFKQNLGRSLFKSAKSGLGRMAQEAVGEGLEEAFAEAVNPLLKKWTYDPDAKGATFSEIWDSAVVGALTSIAFGGTVGQLPTYKNASRISRIQDQVNEYNDAVDKLYQDSANGKLNAEERQARQDELAKRKVIIEENISSIMQEFDKGWNITQKSRELGKQDALKRINASGNLKMGLNSEGKLVDIQDKANPNNIPYNVLASAEMANKVAQTKDFVKGANIEAISSNMSGQEHLIQYKPTSNPLTTEMKTALKTFADFSKAKGQNQKFVVVDKNDSQFKGARGLIVDDTGVIYLREDLSANDVINNLAQVTAIHEFSHGLENTGAYQELTKFVFNTLAKNAELAKQFGIENFEADYKRIATLYATNENTRDAFNRKSAKEQREYIQSEYMAKFLSEKAFTDGKTIRSLCRTNQSLGQKILNWLKDFVDRLNSVNKVERQMKVFLQKARNLYSTAIQQSGNIETRKNIAYALNEQNLDKESDVKYSNDDKKKYKKTPYSQWKSEALAWASRAEKGLYRGFYDGYGSYKVIVATGDELVYDVYATISANNYDLIEYYEEFIDENNEKLNRDANKLSRIAQRITNNIGFSNNNRSDVARRRTDSRIRTMDATESNGNGKRNVKESSGVKQQVKLSLEDSNLTQYGEGYLINKVDVKNYNLVDVQDKKQFKNLLSNLVRQVKSGVEMKTGANMNLRHGLFNCLQNQKNNVYSKLAEINTAYEKTVSAYNKNNAINIPQTFIQALGYNGVIDGKDGVVYDLNNKKKNLLDYSEDRAKERLDRAIRLFGETDNPAKAGWLLADGRFVDYHRDSANIYTGNILDYEDHWQIEKVFDTRRGTDAIDAFMAEGNIRLMPEAGGIELRGKPNKNQIDRLEDFINKVIDKEGITLDLRPAGTTENHKPNPVSYDSTASAKEIMQDINSYYNTGKIAKVVDGVKFSLDEDIDSMLKDWWDNLSLEDLNEMIQDELKDFDTKEEVKLSKEERRELYVKKLYEEGKLNSVVTKLVNKNPQMKEYFKDTQMNMKYNPLSMLRTKGDEYIVMFHGTPNKNFNEFSPSFIGDNGSVMGEGFYFTESLEYANDYKQRDGRVIATLLDIKKPLSRNKVTVTRDELKTFIQDVLVKHKKNYLENFNNDIDFTVNYWINHYENDIDLIQGMHEHSVMLWEDFYSGLRDSIGYDGVIAWNKAEGTQAIVFNSNQIKDIFNHKPTKSADIRYALEEDSDGNKLSDAQQEFFKDSMVRDENGNLLVVYHGTDKDFNVFDNQKSLKSIIEGGLYFATDREDAEWYAKRQNNQGRVIKAYLNITGYLDLTNHSKDYIEDVILHIPDDQQVIAEEFNRDLRDGDFSFIDIANEVYKRNGSYRTACDVIYGWGYDGVKQDNETYVAFNSNQIKETTNKNPTESPDIRYSLTDSEGNKLSKIQQEFFKDSKIRDTNGKLLVVYHGSRNRFTIFDKSKTGESSKQARAGFWFTESKQGASNFANDIWYGKSDKPVVYSVYLNIKNPKIYESYKVEESEIQKLKDEIKSLEKQIDEIDDKYAYWNTSRDRANLLWDIKRDYIYKFNDFDESKWKDRNVKDIDEVLKDGKQIISLMKKLKDAKNNYHKYRASDAYEQFRTDFYLSAGMSAEDANIGGLGMAMNNSDEKMTEFVDNLKNQGYDGIVIKNTEYDSETLGEGSANNQYVAFDANQIKKVTNKKPSSNFDIRYALDENIDEDVKNAFGTTSRWTETGYLMTDGSQLDLSGKKDGGMPNRRSVDHREIFDIYEDADDYGTDAMIQFMAKGHIRVSPEYPGINIQVEPNEVQYKKLKNFIEDIGYRKEYFMIDFDDKYGDTVDSLEYDNNFTANKIIDDIRYYYKNGELPKQSELSQFRYSLPDDVDNTQSNNVEYKLIEGFGEDELNPRLQNAIVEYAQRWAKNHKKFLEESIAEWEEKLAKDKEINIPAKIKIDEERLEKYYAEYNKFKKEYKIFRSKTGKWVLSEIHREGISRLSQKDGNKEINGSKETVSLLEYLIDHEKFYKTYDDIEGYRMKIVDKTILPKIFHDIINENESIGIRTFYFVDDAYNGDTDETEGFCGICMGDNRIFLKIHYDNPDFIEINKHERLHYIKIYHEDIYNNFKNQILNLLTDKESLDLYNKYYYKYEDAYNLTLEDFESKENQRVWEEIFAQIYAEAEVPNNYRKINFAIGEFDNTIKKRFGLEKDLQFSLDDDFDISDYYIPSDDGFFNAENPKLKGQERDTEAIKYRAKLKQNKVFSREELEKVIDEAINQKQNIRLTGKRRETAIGELFKRMNTQDVYEKRKTAQDIANFIINNVFYDEIYTDTYEQQVAEFEMIDYYKGHFELNNQIKQELEYRTENGARIINAWKEKGVNKLSDGTTKAKPGVNPHDVAQDLNDNGLKIDMDKSETEIFLDIYDRYNALDEAIKEFKAQQKELAINKLESSTMKSYRDDLIETILRAYDEKGSKTPYAKLKETYQTNLQNIKAELKDVKKYANAYVNYLVSNKRAKELVKGNKHYSAGVLEDPTLKGFLKAIAQTGNIKTIKRTARARIQKLAEVYNTSKKGSLFNDILGQEQEMTEIFGVKDSVYDENIANMIEYIAQGQGELTTDEIILLTKITDGLIHLYTTYDKVFKNGKYVETEKLAKDYGEKMRVGIDVRNKSKLLKGMWRFRAMFDPHTVMRNLDGYRCEYNEDLGVIEDGGFFTEMFQDITDGEVKANVAELELLKPFGEFFKSHKGFEKGLTKDKIKLNGTQIKTNGIKIKTEVEMSVGEAISIYLTSLRPQSNFYDSSVILQNKDKTTSEYSFDVKQINELFGKFTEAQKQYIKLVQKFFNEEAQKLKVETDLATLGYTNIEDSGVYFPINREKSAIAKNLGDTQVILDAINTYTLSFNKDVRPGAKLPIRISNVYGIVQNHARGMGAYYGLSIPLKTFNRVFNKQIESMGKQSLKRIASSQMYDSVKYIDQLLKDIQGRQYDNTIGGKALRWMRGNYAKFQLGFNPKTILGQTSSYMMASTYLDADALAKGLVMKTNTEQMFKYAPFTRYRMQEKTIVKAQGVIDKVNSWTDTFTKGIEWMDNNVVKKLWNASQVQIEKNTGHKIGTEENLKRASKLLEKVVRETQSNSIASEKTSLARSENEVIASLTMFSSDSQKQVSRLVDGFGLLSARKQWIANGTIKVNDKIAKVAKKQIFRAGAGYVTATAMFVLIGIMMKHLLGKNDEDETITEEFLGDFKTQVAGLIPIYRDVYGFMNDGYELDNYAYGMINDALQGAKSMNQLTEDIVSGKQLSKSEIGMPLRRSIYSLAQLFGVPVRNVWNYGYGIVNQFSPSTAYRMNSLFYDAKLTDLDKSIQSGNDAKSIAIIKEIFESKNLKIDSNYTREVLELYKEGVNVIPGEIKDSFSYNGEDLTLTNAQHKQLLDAMNKVLTNFNDVVKQAEYKKLSATQKRAYLNNLYDINYILNLARVIGVDKLKESDLKKFLFASVLDGGLFAYMAYIKTFESDKDEEGNTVINSRKKKITAWINKLKVAPAEKYILMSWAGYKNTNGESAVDSYLRRKGVSKTERETMLKLCGY